MKQIFFRGKRALLFKPCSSSAPVTRMTKFTFIDGTSQSYNVQTLDKQWLVREHFCEIHSPTEWVITNETNWNFSYQPDFLGENTWWAEVENGSDVHYIEAEGDENATQLHFSSSIIGDIYAEKRSINWLKKIISIELGENVTVDESALEGLDLAPVYSQTPTYVGGTVNPPTYDGATLVCARVDEPGTSNDGYWSIFRTADSRVVGNALAAPVPDSAVQDNTITWSGADSFGDGVTATLVRTDIIGYTHRKTIIWQNANLSEYTEYLIAGSTFNQNTLIAVFGENWKNAYKIEIGVGPQSDQITTIPESAFYINDNTPTYMYIITLPNTITNINANAFRNCKNLKTILLPNSLTTISRALFTSCDSLTNITIPNNVETIADYVFSGCSSLTNITIPSKVISIGSSVFSNCSSLRTITVLGKTTTDAKTLLATAAVPRECSIIGSLG